MATITYVTDFMGPGVTDAQAFQAAIDHVYTTVGGGHVVAPSGNFVTPNLVIKGGVLLHGSGRGYGGTLLLSASNPNDPSADASIITFNNTADRAGLFDIQLQGYQFVGRQNNNLINIVENRRIDMVRVWADGGDTCLFNNGCDCRITNCLFSGKGFACLTTNGANWYQQTSFDAPPSGPQYGIYIGIPNATLQQAGAMENFFDQCDISGGYTSGYSISINDANTHISYTTVNNSVVSAGVAVGSARVAAFGGGSRFGGAPWAFGTGAVSVVGCHSIAPLALPASVVKAGNINIT